MTITVRGFSVDGSTAGSTSRSSISDSNSSCVLTEPKESLLTGIVGVVGMSTGGMTFLNANGWGKSGGKPFLAAGFAAGKSPGGMTTGSGETHEVSETSSGGGDCLPCSNETRGSTESLPCSVKAGDDRMESGGVIMGDIAGSGTFSEASRMVVRPRLLLDDWGGRISIGAEIGVEGGYSGGTWDRVRAAGVGLHTDAISSADDAASSSGVEAPAPDLVVTLTVRIMGRPDGYGSEITIVLISEME